MKGFSGTFPPAASHGPEMVRCEQGLGGVESVLRSPFALQRRLVRWDPIYSARWSPKAYRLTGLAKDALISTGCRSACRNGATWSEVHVFGGGFEKRFLPLLRVAEILSLRGGGFFPKQGRATVLGGGNLANGTKVCRRTSQPRRGVILWREDLSKPPFLFFCR